MPDASVARVLLLNDLNSRIPVLVGACGHARARLGRQRAELKLEFLPDGASLYAGDEVYTSGSDGVLPRGLRVGVVTGADGAFKVRPHAELSSLDVVSVLFFDTPTLTSTDPPAVPVERALSAMPEDKRTPDAVSAPSAAVEPVRNARSTRRRRRSLHPQRRRCASPAMNASLPVLSVLFAVLATAVPWGLPADATFILPLVVVMMVFCWRVLPGASLPPYVAMLLGLLTDVMSGGPLGFWALMALIGAIAGGLTPALGDGHDMKRLWLVWAAVAGIVACLGWLLASLYFLRWIDCVADRLRCARLRRALPGRAARLALDQARAAQARPADHLREMDVKDRRDDKAREVALKLRRRFSRRAVLIAGGQAGLFGLLLWRLRQLQILDTSEYRLLSDENRMTMQLVAPARGSIYDRIGRVVAEDKENFRVIVVPAFCKDLKATLAAVSQVVHISAADKDRVMRAARRQSGYFPVLVTEGLTWRQFTLLSVLAPRLPGVRADRATYRQYVHGSSMAHVVGYVGMADKSEVDEDPMMRVPGFRTGKAGIEKSFDAELRGQPGTIKYEVDAHGRVVRQLGATPSVRGKDMALTIDQELQDDRAEADRGPAHRLHRRARRGDGRDPGDGLLSHLRSQRHVLQGESATGGRSSRETRIIRSENRALRGVYPPGSTFKVVTALAGLEAGVITPDEHMTCPGAYMFGRHRFRCWKRHGRRHRRASSDQAVLRRLFLRDGKSARHRSSRRHGAGSSASVRFTISAWWARSKAIIPDTAWKKKALRQPWYPGETISCGIGQGYVSATPLQLAVVAARIATGRAVSPRLIAKSDERAGAGSAQRRSGASRARPRRHGCRRQ